jgi:biotin carboxyl carrier protein
MKPFTLTVAGIVLAVLTASLTVGDSGSTLQAQNARSVTINVENCIVQLRKQDEAQLAAERPGIIEFIEFEEGDPVQKGQVVAKLKDGVARATLEKNVLTATNDVHIRYADAAYRLAAQELEIATATNARVPGTVPILELKKLGLAVHKALLQKEQAEFEQAVAEKTVVESEEAMKTHEIRAPFSGVVSAVFRTAGEAVRQGDPILEIISTEVLGIEGLVTIDESYVVKSGDKVRVQLDTKHYDLPEHVAKSVFVGEITWVDPRPLILIGKTKVAAKVENLRGFLRPQLRALMSITPAANPQTAGR